MKRSIIILFLFINVLSFSQDININKNINVDSLLNEASKLDDSTSYTLLSKYQNTINDTINGKLDILMVMFSNAKKTESVSKTITVYENILSYYKTNENFPLLDKYNAEFLHYCHINNSLTLYFNFYYKNICSYVFLGDIIKTNKSIKRLNKIADSLDSRIGKYYALLVHAIHYHQIYDDEKVKNYIDSIIITIENNKYSDTELHEAYSLLTIIYYDTFDDIEKAVYYAKLDFKILDSLEIHSTNINDSLSYEISKQSPLTTIYQYYLLKNDLSLAKVYLNKIGAIVKSADAYNLYPSSRMDYYIQSSYYYNKKHKYKIAVDDLSLAQPIIIAYDPNYFYSLSVLKIQLMYKDEDLRNNLKEEYVKSFALLDSITYSHIEKEVDAATKLNNLSLLDNEKHLVRYSRMLKIFIAVILILIVGLIVAIIAVVITLKRKKLHNEEKLLVETVLKENISKGDLQSSISNAISKPLDNLMYDVNLLTSAKQIFSEEEKIAARKSMKRNTDILMYYLENMLLFSRLEMKKILYVDQKINLVPIIKDQMAKAGSSKYNVLCTDMSLEFDSLVCNMDPILFAKFIDRTFIHLTVENKKYEVKARWWKDGNNVFLSLENSPMLEDAMDVYVRVKSQLNIHFVGHYGGRVYKDESNSKHVKLIYIINFKNI
ncbi:MAG: hypothetical protein WC140_02125 [Bacteroidales bacterium]